MSDEGKAQFGVGALRKNAADALRSIWLKINPVRRRQVDAAQRRALAEQNANCDRAIIFLVPGLDRVDGGILSISSLVEESLKLEPLHGAAVFACPHPRDPPLAGYTQFDNNLRLVGYKMLIAALVDKASEILFHVPEIHAATAAKYLNLRYLRERGVTTRVNVLLQNIDYAPTREDLDRLRQLTSVSITTAHKAYTTPEVAERLGCPLFHLSVWISPDRFEITPPESKKNIVMISPDAHPMRSKVMAELERKLPNYEFRVVQDMPYREYRSLCSSARLAVTFGEGLDGYYIESIFSGGISSAVFNDRFFLPKYRDLPLMYETWEELAELLPSDLIKLESDKEYIEAHRQQMKVASSDYVPGEYARNLAAFYESIFQGTGAVFPAAAT